MDVRFTDEFDGGFGWTVADKLPRTAHALATSQGVWLVDPVDAPAAVERAHGLGEIRGVIQLLDRHSRDCEALAAQLGVPRFEVPAEEIPGSTLLVLPIVRSRFWNEVALWSNEHRTLVCADALGTLPFFRAPGERLGLHPLLRLRPTLVTRSLRGLTPEHVLCGHGEGVHGETAAAVLEEALSTARRRLPRAWANAARQLARRRS